jgi:predicted nucleic acid-binding protein
MRVLVDTNVLLSALWFRKSGVARALFYVVNNHELVLCDQNIAE